MALNVTGDFGNLHFQFNLAGDPQPMFTALGVRFTDETSTEDRAEAGLAAMELSNVVLATETPEDYSIGPGIVEVGVSEGDNVFVDGTTTEPGEQVIDATQQNTAWLIKKSTLDGGRSGRGRMYVPGAVDAFVAPNGVLDPAYLGNLQTLTNDLALAILSVPLIESLVLFHNNEGGLSPPEGTDIIALTVDNVVATQRRRLR